MGSTQRVVNHRQLTDSIYSHMTAADPDSVMALRLLSQTPAMRNLFTMSTGLILLAATAACETGPADAKDPPVLRITSPARGLLQDHAGQVVVTGTVEPNAKGDPIDKVLVNNVQATVQSDGTFNATIQVSEGATLIQTIATDTRGTTATDTRAVQAGQLRPVGMNIPGAVTAAMSADSFAKISAAAGPIIKGLNMGALLAPLQPMVHVGDENGEDGAFARAYVDDLKFSDVKISLAPVQGGLAFNAEIDHLDVPGHARYALLYIPGSTTFRITADKIIVAGTLNVTPNGMNGFSTKLANPNVSVTNFHLEASGLPGEIIGDLHLDTAIQTIIAKGAELAMNPLMNQALGALSGPQQLAVLGKNLTMQVAPSTVSFTPTGALIAMNMKMLIAGGEASPGFIYTDNGAPSMDPDHGFQIGLADDLANELLAEAKAAGALDLTLPEAVGTFDAAQIQMTLPPMISADASDGALRLVLGDMLATFTSHGTPVAKAAISAKLDLQVSPLPNGTSVAIQLGTPELHVDTLDDVDNATGFDDKTLAKATTAVLGAQIDSISKLLVAIPIPAVAGLQVSDLSIGSDNGYVMVKGAFE
jgi:Glucodextranase, domain B